MGKGQLKIYADGGARGNPGPAACAFVAVRDGKIIHRSSKYLGETTNNAAEYNAVLLAYEWLKENKGKVDGKIIFFLDSELVARQLTGSYKIKNEKLKLLAQKIKNLEISLDQTVTYKSVPRVKNILADKLVNEKIDENSP